MRSGWRRWWLRWSAGCAVTTALTGGVHSAEPQPLPLRPVESTALAEPPAAPAPALHEAGEGYFPPPLGDCCAEHFWFGAEYLNWWIKDGPLAAPLLTTGPANIVGPGGRSGTLGLPGTRILIGGNDVDLGQFSGGRFTLGRWLDDCRRFGIEGSYFFLGQESNGNTFSAPGTPGSTPLSIPYFNALLGRQDTTGVAAPQQIPFSGTADFQLDSRLQGAELNGICNLSQGCGLRLDLLGGFRWLNLEETLRFDTISSNIPPLPRDLFRTRDRFESDNNFYGGQIGARAELRRGAWFASATGKVALGDMNQTTRVEGLLRTNDFTRLTRVQSFPGAYFALPSNLGSYTDNQFAVVPEGTFSLGWQPRSWARIFVGYTFLYVSSVGRPGEQIDRVVNPRQGPGYTGIPNTAIIGPPRPLFPGRIDDFWAQGLNFGIELRY